jgi:hypothetical protein
MADKRPIALVTGASSGIGAALAEKFAAEGHQLVLVARRQARLDALAGAIAAAGRQRPHVLAIDLATPDAGDAVERQLEARGLEPAIVINNAGFGLLGDAAALDRAEQLRIIDVNARILTDLSLRFVDSLARHRGGILNVASVASFLPGPGMAVYHATKAYVLSFSEALHYELKPRGVRVTALCPGYVDTEFGMRAEGFFARRLQVTLADTVRQGYRGFMAGRRVVVTDVENKIVAALTRWAPRSLMISLAQAVARSPYDAGPGK